MIGCEQPPEWHPEGDVYTHTLIMLDLLEPDAPLELCLAVLLHDIAKPPCRTIDGDSGRIRFNGHDAMGAEMAETILRRLRYPNDTLAAVVPMVARHMQFMNVQKMRVAKLKRFMAAPTFAGELELHRVDCASSNGFTDNYDFLQAKAAEFAAQPLIPPPLVSGRDLIRLGLEPGPRFKEILEAIQTEQLEGRILEREPALAYLRQLAANENPESGVQSPESRTRNVETPSPPMSRVLSPESCFPNTSFPLCNYQFFIHNSSLSIVRHESPPFPSSTTIRSTPGFWRFPRISSPVSSASRFTGSPSNPACRWPPCSSASARC